MELAEDFVVIYCRSVFSLFRIAFICSHRCNPRRTCVCLAVSKVFLLGDSTSNISICCLMVGIKQVLSVCNIAVRRGYNSVVYLSQLLSFCPALCCYLVKTYCCLPRFASQLILMGWWGAAAVLLVTPVLLGVSLPVPVQLVTLRGLPCWLWETLDALAESMMCSQPLLPLTC